ncbi:MAG: iron-sulfur cluster-binding domain-containing protein [Deltaproteobacteria bacterium]|nr:iron-sulfur cluster-binding domain-containing protein [Deltaproteobacteria bacterium]
MEVYGKDKDLNAFFGLVSERQERVKRASPLPDMEDPISDLSRMLHPEGMRLVVSAVRDETPSVKTFRLEPPAGSGAGLPVFRPGQYVSLKAKIGDVWITRPYSISSSPSDVLTSGYYELTIQKKEGGFFTGHIWDLWKGGTVVALSGPHGNFYHDSLRDSYDIVAIAGGSGITPIRSMVREIFAGDLDAKITLLYGIRTPDCAVFSEEFDMYAARYPEQFRVVYVCSEPDDTWRGSTGFITASCITEHAGDVKGKTFFVCGPREMYGFLDRELDALDIPRRRIRKEASGEPVDIASEPEFPVETKEMTFSLVVHMGNEARTISAKAVDTILVSLEKAGIGPDSQCRSGECGLCRSLLMAGDVFVRPDGDGRRAADKKFGYIHLCSSYPISDLEIRIPLTGGVVTGENGGSSGGSNAGGRTI